MRCHNADKTLLIGNECGQSINNHNHNDNDNDNGDGDGDDDDNETVLKRQPNYMRMVNYIIQFSSRILFNLYGLDFGTGFMKVLNVDRL